MRCWGASRESRRPLAKRTGPPRVSRWPHPRRSAGSADLDDVLGGGALLALDDLELDPVAFLQRLEAVPLNRRIVNEAVLLAVLRRDEAEALRVVEPLHGTGRTHALTPD